MVVGVVDMLPCRGEARGCLYDGRRVREGFFEGMQLIRTDFGGEGPWSVRGETQQSLPRAVRYDCRPWGRDSVLVLENTDGGRQLVADVEARDKSAEDGGTADAGATVKSFLRAGSAAHGLDIEILKGEKGGECFWEDVA